jgi:hypothetical protein
MRRRGRALRRRYGRAGAKEGFQKVWFSRPDGEKTAGLILPAAKLRGMSIGDISRLFPVKEGLKMHRLHTSPVFATWDAAFHFKT